MKPKHLILTLLTLLISIAASAHEWTDANGTIWSFDIEEDHAVLTSSCTSGTIPQNLTIPSSVYVEEIAYPVTHIGEGAFCKYSSLTSVTIPFGITSIGNKAFQDCSSLISITIPNSVESIGDEAFNNCFNLPSIEIPASCRSIGNNAFNSCFSLAILTFHEGLEYIGYQAFMSCTSLTSVTIPEGCNRIEGGAFQFCSELQSIILPTSMEYLSSSWACFYGCKNLVTITLPNGIHEISELLLFGCSRLTSIIIPEGIESVGDEAFAGCERLREIHFKSDEPEVAYEWPMSAVLFVPDAAVAAYKAAWPNYTNMIVPESSSTNIYSVNVTAKESSSAVIEAIGAANVLKVVKLKVSGTINSYDVMAFCDKMINLIELDLSEATVVGSDYRYYGNYHTQDNIITGRFAPAGIRVLTLPSGITVLESEAFTEASLLQSMTLPEGITSIPFGTFSACKSLTNVNIPTSVTGIEDYAFYGCEDLISITLPERLQTIGSHAFFGCSRLTELKLPPLLNELGFSAFNSDGNIRTITCFTPNVVNTNESCFSVYSTAKLRIPGWLYKSYYYSEGAWKQFLNIEKCNIEPGTYKEICIDNSDGCLETNEDGIPPVDNETLVDAEIKPTAGFIVGENVDNEHAQLFDEVVQVIGENGNGGSLICQDDGSTQGNMRVNRLWVKIKVKAGRWHFFCFPFNVTIANCTYPGQYVWRYYDGAYRAEHANSGWKNVTGATLNSRQGYAFRSSKDGELIVNFETPTFGGNRPTALESHSCDNAQHANWNFVGNPYSSFYDFNENDITSPITVWNGSSYVAYRPGDDDCHLQPYQAFFMQRQGDNAQINFNPSRRETYHQSVEQQAAQVNARRAKGINPQRRLINLEIMSGEESVDRTRVVFNNEAKHIYEMECDAAKFLSTDAMAQLYSLEGNVQMAINERPLEGDIRLGYVAKKSGAFCISASRMDMPMVLIDTQMGVTFDLSLGSYNFDTQAGTFEGRFLLRPSGEATAINGLMAKTGVCIGTQDGGIAIGGAENKTVNIYTTGGVQAALHTGNGFVSLKSGVYVVNVDGVSAKLYVK